MDKLFNWIIQTKLRIRLFDSIVTYLVLFGLVFAVGWDNTPAVLAICFSWILSSVIGATFQTLREAHDELDK